jgi:integrase
MEGGIYSGQGKCACGGSFADTGRGLFCEHCNQPCRLLIVKFKTTMKRFTEYEKAARFLNALRFQADQDDYDPRDYRSSHPLGFATLSEQWLNIRRTDGTRCVRNLERHILYGRKYFENRNVKDIGYGDIEDFFHHLRSSTSLSGKSLHNIRTTLHSFFRWIEKREKKNGQGFTVPDFPEVRYEIKMRKVLDKDTQLLVLDEVKRISWAINPKIYLGCLWLSTYINVRPGEMIKVLETDVDLSNRVIHVHHTKERDPVKSKIIHLLDEDVTAIRSFPRGLPHMPFFRHEKRKGVSHAHKAAGGAFGKDYLYKWWRKACENLGIEGVSLYPGTRHTTAVALSDAGYTPEEIMDDGTQHSTSKAFRRYFHLRVEKRRAIAGAARANSKCNSSVTVLRPHRKS